MSEYETELFKRLDAAESEIENLKEFIHKDGLRIAMFIQNEAIANEKIKELAHALSHTVYNCSKEELQEQISDFSDEVNELQAKLDDTEGYLFDATELIQEAYEQYMEIICYGTTDASLSTQPFRRFLDKMEKRNEGE